MTYLSYVNMSTNTTENRTTSIAIPGGNKPDVTVSGSCGNKSSSLGVNWPMYKFELYFEKVHPENTSDTKWEISNMTVIIDTKNNSEFLNPVAHTISVSAAAKEIGIKVPQDSAYLCNDRITYSFTEGVKVYLADVKLQPFDVHNGKYSDNLMECGQDKPKPKVEDNNIVPIAVGCALAGLVLIVLIAYIIGRRKSQRGYEKV